MRPSQSQVGAVVQAVGARLDRKTGPHLYRQIAQAVREQLRSGLLKPGQSLPPQRELSAIWGIGEVTIRRAFQALAQEGLVEARAGSGTVVVDAESVQSAGLAARTDLLTLGVAFADLADGYPFFRPILAGLRDRSSDVAIRLFDMPERDQAAGTVAHAPPLADLDGLILMSPVNLGVLALAQRRRLPTVLLFGDLSDGFSHCIMPDYASGITAAVGHLAGTGRRRIAMITAGSERFSTGRWMEGYRAAIQAYGLASSPDWIVQAGYTERDGARATRALLALDDRPDAIVYASDFMARGGLLAAHDLGVHVPEDLAVVGAGPVLEDGGWTVPLATIDLGLHDMGRLARQAIEAGIERRSNAPLRQAVASHFRKGQTA